MHSEPPRGLVATASTEISAEPGRVWRALTDPAEIEQYMFGSIVDTDWRPGSPITWRGRPGLRGPWRIVAVEPPRRLEVTHFSPLSGKPDVPESCHRLVYALTARDGVTTLSLAQDGNDSAAGAEPRGERRATASHREHCPSIARAFQMN